MPSLKQRLEQLEQKILAGRPLGPSTDIPFGIFVYDPAEELEMRRQASLFATRLENGGKRVRSVDLGALLWACLDESPLGPRALEVEEAFGSELEAILHQAHTMVAGQHEHEPGPLERRIIEQLADADRVRDFALLSRAGELFPIYRTSALLERLIGHVRIPTLLLYPGTMTGPTELRFMGVCDPSPNYRPTIYA
ncbi:MAG: DUF1788 domain-containing protein [Gemmatimonadetes bacterium]|nr:DUF1788 domain-containing protein [Gemmatimonadota bacterium]